MPNDDLRRVVDAGSDPDLFWAPARAELLTGLDEAVAEVLLDQPIDPLIDVQIRHLGAALAGPSARASGPPAEPYMLHVMGLGRRARDPHHVFRANFPVLD